MRLYVFRHGESVANTKRVYNPEEDEMTSRGRDQVLRAAAFIHSLALDAVFCSPLPRTRETAKLLDLEPIFDARIADRRFGEFAGQPYGSLGKHCKSLGVEKYAYVPENGESIEQHHARVRSFLDELPEGTYLLITHGAVINYLQQLLEDTWKDSENASLWVFEDGRVTQKNWRPWDA